MNYQEFGMAFLIVLALVEVVFWIVTIGLIRRIIKVVKNA
jgi:hypothetical protein